MSQMLVGAVGITPQVLMGRLTEKIATLMSFEHRGGPAKVSTAHANAAWMSNVGVAR